ncbi:hypothetical protein [uncultured Thiodictyon sp.]|uniref:hypothetical protein n=1 Tax=uncultured Thiodictyon sp. TaxID=1846217 RepID=UPI0025E246C3|nr:hypothetical protein [uncultured Thiodictyon sp.]
MIWEDIYAAPGSEKIRLHAVRFISDGQVTSDIEIEKELAIELEFWNLRDGAIVSSSIHLLDQMGGCVFASGTSKKANLVHDEWYGKPHPVGLFKTTCVIPANFLNNGGYSVHAIMITDTMNIEVAEKGVLSFNAHEAGTLREDYLGPIIGVVRPRLAWTTEPVQAGLEPSR